MFSLPNSKRVRREGLYSTESSGVEDSVTDDHEIEGLLKAKFEESYGGEENLESRDIGDNGSGSHAGGDEFEFRLFSSNGPGTKPSKIVLRSPSPKNIEPGFVVPSRPESYYFARTAEREREFESITVEGTELLNRAAIPWPGCALPWRVITVKMARLPAPPQPSKSSDTISTSRRKRPGKKRRILLRKKMVAKLEHEERAAKDKIEKEAAEREKRTRRNREKKIKRRMKEKIKKAGEETVRGTAGAAEAAEDSREQAIASDREVQKDYASKASIAIAKAAQ